MDHRDRGIELGKEPGHVRLDESGVVVRAECADPAIEDLERLGPAAAWAFR